MLNLTLQHQTPARFTALKYSFGISANATTQATARRLAPTVKAIKPGVFLVGACTCDLWEMSCSCKAARTRKAKNISQDTRPCPHFVALYLSMDWTPGDPDPVKYLKSAGIEQPEIIAYYCRVFDLPACYPPAPAGFRVLETYTDGIGQRCADLENVATGTHVTRLIDHLTHVHPFYA
jgi:hypothetical protein